MHGVTVLCCGKQHPGGVRLKTQTVCRGILFLTGSKEGWSGSLGRDRPVPSSHSSSLLYLSVYCSVPNLHTKPHEVYNDPYNKIVF